MPRAIRQRSLPLVLAATAILAALSAEVLAQAQGDMAVSATQSPVPVEQGQELTYVVTVHNRGSADEANVRLTLGKTPNVNFEIVRMPSYCRLAGTDSFECIITQVPAGGQVTTEVVVRPTNPAGGFRAEASVGWNLHGDRDLSNNTVTLDNRVGEPGGFVEDVPPDDCTIEGTPGNDVLAGGGGDDVICGLGGDDRLSGNGGQDRVYGGGGDDLLYGNQGPDSVFGGAGNDRMDGKVGADAVSGGPGHDTVVGGQGNDRLLGDSGRDLLSDGQGRNSFLGGTGDDVISSRRKEVRESVNCGPGSRDRAIVDSNDSVSACETVSRPPLGPKQPNGADPVHVTAAAAKWPPVFGLWARHKKSKTRWYAWYRSPGTKSVLTCLSKSYKPSIVAAFADLKSPPAHIRYIRIEFRAAAIDPAKSTAEAFMAAAQVVSRTSEDSAETDFWFRWAPVQGIGIGLKNTLRQVFVQYRVSWFQARPLQADKRWRTPWIDLGNCGF